MVLGEYKKVDDGVSEVLVVPELEDIWSSTVTKLGKLGISKLLEIFLQQWLLTHYSVYL